MEGRQVTTMNQGKVLADAVKTAVLLDKKAREKSGTIAQLWEESYKKRF